MFYKTVLENLKHKKTPKICSYSLKVGILKIWRTQKINKIDLFVSFHVNDLEGKVILIR